MAYLYSTRNIVKIPSTLLSESKPKWELKISLQELKANNQLIGLASSYITRTLDVVANTGYSEEKVKEIKQKIKALTKEKSNAKTKRELQNYQVNCLVYYIFLICVVSISIKEVTTID